MSTAWYDPRIARGMAKQLTRWHERLKSGEKALGWKVGFGAPAAMERLKIQAPLVGFLTDQALLPSGKTVSLSGWSKPVAEPEIAVHIGKDLPGGAGRDKIKAAIAALSPAIELADLDHPPDDVEAILAGNIYQRNLILGPRDASRAGGNLDGLLARVLRNGGEAASTSDPQALTGDLLDIVQHVADMLSAFGERLRAGQIIITGSVVPPLWVEAGEEIAFELAPAGSVSVRFAATPGA
ncbi:MAG TPA: fumarylacetoacetate hydrolase family protein [Burkholderiales bacterium]|nr:fumarylacetoacetate hydrolase family protein [Burkholderiales bacterium]